MPKAIGNLPEDRPGDAENSLKSYHAGDLFHLQTPWTDAQGNRFIVHVPLGLDVFPHMVGIDQWPAILGRYARSVRYPNEIDPEEKIGPKETWRQLFKGPLGDMTLDAGLFGAVGSVGGLPEAQFVAKMSPGYELMAGVLSNRDPVTHYAIVPPEAQKTQGTAAWYIGRYLLNRAIPFLSVYESAERRAMMRPSVQTNPVLKFLMNGPIDYESGMQVERVEPGAGKRERDFELMREAQAKHAEGMYATEQALQREAQGTPAVDETLRQQLDEQGNLFTKEQIEKRVGGLSGQKRDLQNQLLNNPNLTEEQRAHAIQLLRGINETTQLEFLKRMDPASRAIYGALKSRAQE